ncbi:unnamed protein product [Urochloa humidicola]
METSPAGRFVSGGGGLGSTESSAKAARWRAPPWEWRGAAEGRRRRPWGGLSGGAAKTPAAAVCRCGDVPPGGAAASTQAGSARRGLRRQRFGEAPPEGAARAAVVWRGSAWGRSNGPGGDGLERIRPTARRPGWRAPRRPGPPIFFFLFYFRLFSMCFFFQFLSNTFLNFMKVLFRIFL